ncbi:NADH dehydrogenase [Mariprofundus micogutta]|uniref:NADH dehydrogenase n=1 Tax=Mariprofundus micogutta TaxID=1921010 RepID=A0A1L8CJN4_9PROT|nr:MTH938/NDUFAF3 family protein [Mariprofundus micogutta]GAV19123.1 NADH dehydrogenase [Mariprofundus micogutta]
MKGDISAQLAAGTLLFTGYDEHEIKVNEKTYHSGLSIHKGLVTAPWGPDCLSELSIDDLTAFTQSAPEVMILGTGRQTRFPSPEIMAFMADNHIGFECMDSRAAARTYNILVAEGRPASVALLLPSARK